MSKKPMAKATSKKATSTSVARTESKETLPANVEELFLKYEGAGMETVTARDLTIPRLTLLQVLSPQCQKSKPEYIKGAEPGMFCDTATGRLWDGEEGITLLPVMYQLSWIEWAPRKTNRGLIMIHGDDAVLKECTKNDKGQMITPEGNNVIETAQFYVINRSDDDRQVFVPFAGTQRKKAKKWLDLSTAERTSEGKMRPLFYREYLATAKMESNDQGEWFGWKVDRGEKLTDIAIARKAAGYFEAVRSGALRMSDDQLMREASQESSSRDRM